MSVLLVGGLACRTPVRLTGSRAAELDAAARVAWARCLLDVGDAADPESDAVVACLHGPGEEPDGASATGTELASVLQQLTQQVTYAKIAAQTGRLLMLHAGAVAGADGDAIAFVAPGGTGKTTLVRRLGRRFGYLTDETVAVDADARVHPYPKPLSLRGDAAGPKAETSPDDLGLVRPPAFCRLRRLVLLARSDDHAGPPRQEALTRFEAIAALAPETSALSALPRPLHWLDDLLAGLAPVVRLHYREVDTVLDTVAGWLERS
nr:hypothetical protein [Propionibacterium sp.]